MYTPYSLNIARLVNIVISLANINYVGTQHQGEGIE